MDTFNFNSDSYSDNEIENLLHLSAPYDFNDIQKAKQVLIGQLGNNNMAVEKQREIAFFIDLLASLCVNFVCEEIGE